ncbi:HAD-IIIA family hydrolase [Thermochromatium tepidum]|uniref:HAD-IIIA family hydrolase n=1 Tax=Thermochromatium tepidum ATCC 43061 TaxID=316276 RepID=A0A6I6EAS7_THETI|nr:HAD-IIIA family hydrolase [Thermochromatium tepidum]QGU32396.1 HAD-IIIA family hydrolase [Thermochromatium tepidum ATCC 43061]
MDFELIVFDWDGTLMDSEARIVTCIQAAFRDLGLPEPMTETARDVIGLGLDEAMARLLPAGDAGLRAQVALQYRLHFLGDDQHPSELFPGARETLAWMAEQGYRLAVATGKSRAGLNKSLAETGLEAVFHATRTADETFSKPHPQMLLELMAELGVSAEKTLMIGDTEYDLQMANNAGARSLAVCYGVHDPGRLMACGPLACLDSLWAIRDWLSARRAD